MSIYHSTGNSSAYWLIAFVPALIFYLNLLSSTFFINRYLTVSNHIVIADSSSAGAGASNNRIFELVYLKHTNDGEKKHELRYGLELLWESEHYDSSYYTGLVWRDDVELGRGYLLYSDTGENRIWRWEIGGGPIAIGRTLYMERSGCRSNASVCESAINIGSSGAMVEVGGSLDSSGNRKLVICERGERRVIRIEEDGARTPLATHTNNLIGENNRLNGPYDLTYSPFGDLIFTDPSMEDSESTFGGIWRVPEASRIKAIKARKSKQAHFIEVAPSKIELLYSRLSSPLGVVFSKDLECLLVTNRGDLRIYQLPMSTLDNETTELPRRRLEVIDNLDFDEAQLDIEIEMLEYDNMLGETTDQEDLDEYIKKIEDEMLRLNVDDELKDVPLSSSVDSEIVLDSETNELDSLQAEAGLLDMHDPENLIFFDASTISVNCSSLGGMEIDMRGNVWVAAGSCGIAILSPTGDFFGRIPYPDDDIIDVSFGDDGYMYATTANKLLRMKVKTKRFHVPDMINR